MLQTETRFVTRKVRKNTATRMRKKRQSRNRPMAALTETAFPPLKPKYRGKQWPIRQPKAAMTIPGDPASREPRYIARAVFTPSPTSVAKPTQIP